MFSVDKCYLPENALLSRYRDRGDYTECYTTTVDGAISQANYVRTFYTTAVFKAERLILKWAVSKPSTDEEAGLLADDELDAFAAWNVEARRDDQILLCDYQRRTRSWLMSEISSSDSTKSTRLWFGSAVVRTEDKKTGELRMETPFSLLLQFHKLYSVVLLASARSRLLSRNDK